MPLRFAKSNLVKIPADIIVNPSDGSTFNDSNVSKAISDVCGERYLQEIESIGSIKCGEAVFTAAGNTSYKYVAHVALPDWYGGQHNECEYLDSCYTEVLYRADEKHCKTIVFPILGIGVFGIPYKQALKVAIRAIEAYLTIKDNLYVYIATIADDVFEYIKTQYPQYCLRDDESDAFASMDALEYKLSHLDYTFMDSLLHYMRRAGMTSAQCYTAAGIDKKLFSKIKNNPKHLPRKDTIIKFSFALHLSLTETQQLLGTCGYVLSDSLVADVITKHYLSQRSYNYELLEKEVMQRSP